MQRRRVRTPALDRAKGERSSAGVGPELRWQRRSCADRRQRRREWQRAVWQPPAHQARGREGQAWCAAPLHADGKHVRPPTPNKFGNLLDLLSSLIWARQWARLLTALSPLRAQHTETSDAGDSEVGSVRQLAPQTFRRGAPGRNSRATEPLPTDQAGGRVPMWPLVRFSRGRVERPLKWEYDEKYPCDWAFIAC